MSTSSINPEITHPASLLKVDLSLWVNGRLYDERHIKTKDIPNLGDGLRVVLYANESDTWNFPRFIAVTQDGRFYAVNAPEHRDSDVEDPASEYSAIALTPAEVLQWIAFVSPFGDALFTNRNILLFTEAMAASLKGGAL